MSMFALTSVRRFIEEQPVGTLTGCSPALLYVLADLAGDDGRAWPSVSTLALRVNRDQRNVRHALGRLVEAGVIQREPRHGRSTVYRLTTEGAGATPGASATPGGDALVDPGAGATPPLALAPPTPGADATQNPKDPSTEPAVEATAARKLPAALDRFDEFWATYPRKAGKRAARGAWSKALANADADTVIAAADRYARDPNREDAFTAHPTTWLNRGGWEDDPLPARPEAQTRSQTIQQRNLAGLQDAFDANLAAAAPHDDPLGITQQRIPWDLGGSR